MKKLWQHVLDMRWKYIWWFYMIFAATLFFNNTFGSSSIGLWWLSKSLIYMFCFIFASIRLAKWWRKTTIPSVMPTRMPPVKPPRPGIRPFKSDDRISNSPLSYATSGSIKVRGSHISSIGGNSYIDDVDVWRSDFDSRTEKIIKRTEQNVQKIKDKAKRIEKRNKIKRDEWDTRYL